MNELYVLLQIKAKRQSTRSHGSPDTTEFEQKFLAASHAAH
jgi:hypothetical protein